MELRIGRHGYDLLYRTWAPWDGFGVRAELLRLLDDGQLTPASHPRVLDLGCGTGGTVAELATRGFDVTGIDLSAVAITKAASRLEQVGQQERCRLLQADLCDPRLLDDEAAAFDLLVDVSTLDDLDTAGRKAMAANLARWARPGATLLMWCFYGDLDELPAISFTGPSRLSAGLEPGEEQRLLGDAFSLRERVVMARHQAFMHWERRPDASSASAPSAARNTDEGDLER